MKNPFTGTPMELVGHQQSIMFKGEEVFYKHIGFDTVEGNFYTTTEQDIKNMETAMREYQILKGNESNFKDYLIGVLLIIVFSLIIL